VPTALPNARVALKVRSSHVNVPCRFRPVSNRSSSIHLLKKVDRRCRAGPSPAGHTLCDEYLRHESSRPGASAAVPSLVAERCAG
jgi:hypothetical protein